MTGKENDIKIAAELPQLSRQCYPVHLRHLYIKKCDVVALFFKRLYQALTAFEAVDYDIQAVV